VNTQPNTPPAQPSIADEFAVKDITLTKVDYFWHERIPFGMISLVAGREGGGKSTIVSDIIAHVTRDLKKNAIISNQEDGESIVKARLEAAGADLSKVNHRPLGLGYRLPDDIGLLQLHIERNDIKVVIFDTAAQHLAVHMSNDQEVRKVLSPLARVAEETGCAMIFVTHVLKQVSKSAHPLAAIKGALTGAARSAFFVGPNPDNVNERACVWVKDQYRPLPAGLAFELEQYNVLDADSKVEATTQRAILADSEADIDPIALLQGKAKDDDGTPRADKRASAAEWLTIYLSTGKQPAKELRDDAAKQGISWATIRRAADDVGIEKFREGFGKGSKLWWQLPDGHPALVSDDLEEDVLSEEESASLMSDVEPEETPADDDALLAELESLYAAEEATDDNDAE
jgi:hypothetical protein